MEQKEWNVYSEKEKNDLKSLSKMVKEMISDDHSEKENYYQEHRGGLVLIQTEEKLENDGVSDGQFLDELLRECRGKLGIEN
ncbi:MAG: hypothetical protein HDR01_00825 [Lachnospiraceae bacterium]|nr:hypothetical protein [Lachnospiraceae bacterium]